MSKLNTLESEIVIEFSKIRQSLINYEDLSLNEVVVFFKKYGSNFMVSEFKRCLEKKPPDFLNLRDKISFYKPTLIISKFSVPYNKDLVFEALHFERIEVPIIVKERFSSYACPINVLVSTDGFLSKYATLFPENFVTQSPPKIGDEVYYFINKFVKRFKDVTIPFLKTGKINLHPFEKILDLTFEQINTLSASWVTMHEYFHTKGALPIPTSLDAKSSRSSAALEELRVDLLVIVAANELTKIDAVFGEQLAQFVLAERLLRYPLQANRAGDGIRYKSALACFLSRIVKKTKVLFT